MAAPLPERPEVPGPAPARGAPLLPRAPRPARLPRKGEELELVLARLDEKGRPEGELPVPRDGGGPSEGGGEPDVRRVRTRGAPPGARVRLRAGRRRGGVLEARLLEVLDPGPRGVPARCRHFGTCGGCSLQDLAYGAQLEELRASLARLLARVLGEDAVPEVAPVVPCEPPWGYRNKMDFTFAARRWVMADEPEGADDTFALGLHVPGRYDKVLDVHSCDIAFPEAAPLLASTRRLARELGLAPWDVRTHAGLLRHLVLRKGEATGEIMVDLVTSAPAETEVDALARALLAEHPGITTLVQNVNRGVALVAVGEEERVLHGPGVIHERVGGLSFAISANSFFQTNTRQAERLLALVVERARPRADGLVLDLYCGAGLFATKLAATCERVVGFEVVESAVRDAERNAARNGVANVRFVAGDLAVTSTAESLAALGLGAPDVCVVDPPRAGMHESVTYRLGRLAPRRIVYVSCNPASGVRDVAALSRAGYVLSAVEPIDLFPHTPHLECVLTLDRRGEGPA